MAPMIDMVFLLLVFFMTVSTIAKESRPEMDLAVSTTAAVPEAAPPRDILSIKKGDDFSYYWSNRLVSLEDLPWLLEESLPAGGGELILRAGPELPWEVIQPLLGHCRQASVKEVVFATFED